MKRLLMVAYHFPPLAGSSGIQRTLRFCQYLPAFGWQPAVLSAHVRAFENIGSDLLHDIPAHLEVQRAFALDARRHLSVGRRYPGWIARPDRWLTWLLGALPTGLRMIRRQRPHLIWSTYPIPTAHLIGYWLSRLTGIPWVADFRDPMAHLGYPEDAATWNSYLRVEQKVFRQAARMVFTTAGAARLYRERYPDQAGNVRVIENGYDEASFRSSVPDGAAPALHPGKLTLLHSGIVYPQWRNPGPLFDAVRQLLDRKQIERDRLRLRFRAPEHADFVASLAAKAGIGHMVEILPPVGYQEALAEMCAADGLLALQSADCSDQIPAKVYEYIRARKPVLGLCGTAGDTADLLRHAGCTHLAALDSAHDIGDVLQPFLNGLQSGLASGDNDRFVESASRHARAGELAQLLDEVLLEQAREPGPTTAACR